jgi:serine/threonine protein kinase
LGSSNPPFGLAPGDPHAIGRYRVIRRLGEGGMSVVYTGFDPELDRQVAIKLVDTDKLAEGPSASQRLLREAQALARVSHPHVVPVYDVGTYPGGIYIAMELVQGATLRGWLGETARPWGEVMRMFLQVGRGLAAAHDAGIVHRDVKPENVLVGEDGRARVVDFGLARPAALDGFDDDEIVPANTVPSMLVSDILTTGITRPRYSTLDGEVTSSGIVSGTPAYMAPEQHLGRPASPKSDQFGYCVALWEALYFQRPFEGKTAFAVADAIIEGRIVHVPKRTRVPPWVRNILLRGLATNPDHRYDSMRSLLASLVFTAKIFGG